jgi:branched-subunit amino acid aminotransferase/4-amino-4-deoxychorismate lyase
VGTVRIEVDGRAPTTEQLRVWAQDSYGHFTAMQVRDGRVRGLDLHVARLDAANRELFGTGLDGALVRSHIRHALGTDLPDGTVRVKASRPDPDAPVSVMVTVRPPGGMPDGAHSMQSVPYQRALAHLKRIADFGQAYYRRLAARNGFDDALLTGAGGVVSEGAATNIGLFDGTSVLWPDAPMLAGITMQLLEPRLAGAGLPTRRGPVRLADLPSFAAVFVTNARGIAPVGRVDDLRLPVDPGLMKTLAGVYDSVPWDEI